MVANARRKLLGRARKAVFHCTARCVRRAFLCGLDPTSGEDYSHRRDWIVNREKQLSTAVHHRSGVPRGTKQPSACRAPYPARDRRAVATPRSSSPLADHHQAGQVHVGRDARAG